MLHADRGAADSKQKRKTRRGFAVRATRGEKRLTWKRANGEEKRETLFHHKEKQEENKVMVRQRGLYIIIIIVLLYCNTTYTKTSTMAANERRYYTHMGLHRGSARQVLEGQEPAQGQ